MGKTVNASAVQRLIAMEADHLWRPDGKPPEGWDGRRSGSIYKRLLAMGISEEKISTAILGLALMVDARDMDWLIGKATARCFYHTRTGMCDLLNTASDRWYAERAKPKARRGGFQQTPAGLVGIAALLEGM
jgi:hypothetical protein